MVMRVAGMHAHGVDILDRADDDGVVGLVAHHLHLEFLPAQHRFLDQHFVGGRGFHAPFHDGEEFLAVVGDAAAGAAHGEAGADHGGQAHLVQRRQRLGEGLRRQLHHRGMVAVEDGIAGRILLLAQLAFQRDALGHFQADLDHGLLEALAVLGLVDGVGGGADQLDIVAFQRADLAQRKRGVERGLPAHGGQQGEDLALRHIGPFAGDDLFHDLRRDRFDIGGVRHVGVGHDGGGIGIDQHHPVTFLAQRLAGLGAGIVEFAGLADDDGPRADDQDGVDIGAFGHSVKPCHGRAARPDLSGRSATRPTMCECGLRRNRAPGPAELQVKGTV